MYYVYPLFLFLGIIAVLLAAAFKHWWQKEVMYTYSLTHILKKRLGNTFRYPLFFLLLRSATLLALTIAIARPRTTQSSHELHVTGTNIMLVLDVSGSMLRFDDLHDRRTRIDTAKLEAIKFIEKRKYDAIGLVLFAKEVVTRAPLTLDKILLKNILEQTQVGILSHDGTLLCWGIAAALNRLRSTESKSKTIILLTDGSSTPGDADPQAIIELAKKLGVKIYTIAVGAETGGYFEDPFYGVVKEPQLSVNIPLLKMIAHKTHGAFFESRKPDDLAKIYEKIDLLEKTELVSPISEQYTDYFYYFLLMAFFFLAVELIVRTFRIKIS